MKQLWAALLLVKVVGAIELEGHVHYVVIDSNWYSSDYPSFYTKGGTLDRNEWGRVRDFGHFTATSRVNRKGRAYIWVDYSEEEPLRECHVIITPDGGVVKILRAGRLRPGIVPESRRKPWELNSIFYSALLDSVAYSDLAVEAVLDVKEVDVTLSLQHGERYGGHQDELGDEDTHKHLDVLLRKQWGEEDTTGASPVYTLGGGYRYSKLNVNIFVAHAQRETGRDRVSGTFYNGRGDAQWDLYADRATGLQYKWIQDLIGFVRYEKIIGPNRLYTGLKLDMGKHYWLGSSLGYHKDTYLAFWQAGFSI